MPLPLWCNWLQLKTCRVWLRYPYPAKRASCYHHFDWLVQEWDQFLDAFLVGGVVRVRFGQPSFLSP